MVAIAIIDILQESERVLVEFEWAKLAFMCDNYFPLQYEVQEGEQVYMYYTNHMLIQGGV